MLRPGLKRIHQTARKALVFRQLYPENPITKLPLEPKKGMHQP